MTALIIIFAVVLVIVVGFLGNRISDKISNSVGGGKSKQTQGPTQRLADRYKDSN